MARIHFYQAIATLVGITIGAGVLAVPHAVARAGFLTGLFDLIIIGILMIIVNLCLGEITLRTKGIHQLTGYAEKYLGPWGKYLMSASMIFGIYGAMIAYILGAGQSMTQIFGGPPLAWSLFFFIICATVIHKGITAVGSSEFTAETVKLLIFITLILTLVSSGSFTTKNLTGFDYRTAFSPYGIILFAYLATTAIPEMREELKHHEKAMRKAIIIGGIIPIIIYTFFTLAVVGSAGITAAEIATITIGQKLGTMGVILANLLATLAVFTACIGLGYGLKKMYQYDYKIKPLPAWALTCFTPLLFIILGVHSFAKTIEITGAIAGGLAGILIMIMHAYARTRTERKPEYTITLHLSLRILIVLLFVLGALATVKNHW